MRSIVPSVAVVAAASLLLTLTGCFAADNPRVHSLAAELADLPGVDDAEGSYAPGSINFPASSGISVELESSVTAEQLRDVTEAWAGRADFGKGGSTLAFEQADSDSTLLIDQADAEQGYVADLVPVWLELANEYESVSADAQNGGASVSIRTAAMQNPGEAAATTADIAGVGGGLTASSWSIAPVVVDGDQLARVGVTVSTTDGLPDADALAVLDEFDDAFRAAAELGDVKLDFETAHPAAPASSAGYRVAIQLSPTDLRDTPSNQLNDVLLASSSWQSTLRFADAISPDDRISALFSLYSNPAFANLITFDCAASTASDRNPLGADLWQYWQGATGAEDCT